MPLHRFSHADAEAGVAALEKNGETVTAITADDYGLYVSTTKMASKRKPTGDVEKRA